MGLLDYNTSDGRFLFILPWEGHTLIGTTDRMGPAETSPRAPEEDIEWLLKESAKYLTPDLQFRRSDVLSAWRGWRPLAADPHAAPDAPASRDHVISENPTTGVIFIAGGKWTTWREMAEEVTDRVVDGKGTPCKTLDLKLFGGEGCEFHLCWPVWVLLCSLYNPRANDSISAGRIHTTHAHARTHRYQNASYPAHTKVRNVRACCATFGKVVRNSCLGGL